MSVMTKLKFFTSAVLFMAAGLATAAWAAPFQDDQNKTLPYFSDLLAWFDAGSLSSVYQDAACTSLATSNSQSVACWKDLSGNGRPLTTVVGKGTPLLQNTGPVNRSTLIFSSVNSDVLQNVLAQPIATDYSFFVVMKPAKINSTQSQPLFSNNNSKSVRYFEISTNPATQTVSFESKNNGPFDISTEETAWHVDEFSHNTSQIRGRETLSSWRDGTLLSQKNLTVAGASVLGQATSFNRLSVNTNVLADKYGDYQVAELAIFNRALTDCESRAVSFFFAKKYNFSFLNIRPYDLYTDYGYDLSNLMDLQSLTADPSGNVCANFLVQQAASSIATLANPDQLGQDEVIFFGHNGQSLTLSNALTQQDVPVKLGGERLARVWAVDFKTAATQQAMDITFNVSSLNGGSSAANYALLIDESGTGSFSDASVVLPVSLTGSVLKFSKVTLKNKSAFTLVKNIKNDLDGDGISNADECSSASCPDSDNDGIPDYLESNTLDTDGDGIPNYLDSDDDGDGIPTKNEIATQLDPAGTALNPADTDGDGIPDYLDPDDDGDGIPTKTEVGSDPSHPLDTNGDGIPDYLQKNVDGSRGLGGNAGGKVVKTGKGGSVQVAGLVFLLGLLALKRREIFSRKKSAFISLLSLSFLSAAPLAFAEEGNELSPIYFGGDLGFSYLKPDANGSDYKNDGNSDIGFGLFAGYQLTPSVAVQLSYSRLGSAGLLNTTNQQKGSIDYQAWSVDARKIFWQSDRLAAFAGAGFNFLSNSSSDVAYEKSNTVLLRLVGGLDYAVQPGFYIRPQIERVAGDAAFFSVGLVKYLAASENKTIVAEEVKVEPKKVEAPIVLPPAPVVAKPEPKKVDGDQDHDGVLDSVDKCPDTAAHLKVDANGCAIFDKAFPNVTFDNNSSRITPDALKVLDGLVPEINALGDRKIEVQAYTDNVGEDGYNVWLSDRRAQNVLKYLVSRGVDANRLTAKGYGPVNPVADNATDDGKAKNRRVVFKVFN